MDQIILLICCFLAAFTAGLINAVAGGGTLVSFPVLVGLGYAPVTANITNTIAICPGYCSGILAQRKDFPAQRKRMIALIPIAILGGLVGGLILIRSDDTTFRILVPYLILGTSFLLLVQKPLKQWLGARAGNSHARTLTLSGGGILLFLAAIYGGFFGAGVSVIILAILGLIFDDVLNSLNVLKQALSFAINFSAAIFFLFSGKVVWPVAMVMGFGSLAGGYTGGLIAGRIPSDLLRIVVAAVGILIAAGLFIEG
jgi:uncharacterized membrane protein YfcA